MQVHLHGDGDSWGDAYGKRGVNKWWVKEPNENIRLQHSDVDYKKVF